MNDTKTILGIVAHLADDPAPFGLQGYYFDDMARLAESEGVELFIFSPDQWQGERAEGFAWDVALARWVPRRMDLPRLLYERLSSSSQPLKDSQERLRAHALATGRRLCVPLPMVECLLDKPQFHDFLEGRRLPTLAALPVERLDERSLEGLFAQAERIYIKPRRGSRGKGIHLLLRGPEGTVLRTLDGDCPLGAEPWAELPRLLGHDSYFAQAEARSFPLGGGGAFDLRALVQNPGDDRYQLTGMALRQGPAGQWVSNLDAGGRGLDLEQAGDLLRQHLGIGPGELAGQVEELCLRASRALHEAFGSFMEVAFDLLLTLDQGPVILEGNTKPARWVFQTIAQDPEAPAHLRARHARARELAVRMPMRFARNVGGGEPTAGPRRPAP